MLKLEYRCKDCNDLLFKGNLEKGTKIEVMCKKKIKREIPETSTVKGKKCKTINVFVGS